MSRTYAIADLDEARAYLAHPVLGHRLREITSLANQHFSKGARAIFFNDDVKFHSCVTLFSLAAPEDSVFRQALNLFFNGDLDQRTVAILAAQGRDNVESRTWPVQRYDQSSRPFGPFVRGPGTPTNERPAHVREASIERARRLVQEATTVVVLTGAGVSTASGIPDYRGPDGVWTKDPSAERLSSINDFLGSAEVRVAAWQREVHQREVAAQPNPAHHALVTFERTGKLRAIVTQNIDGLHLAAGSSSDLVFEVHGNSRATRCLSCGEETPTSEVLARVAAGDIDPHCEALVGGSVCGGLLKTAVVSFGQSLPVDVFGRAELLVKTCDLLICVGSSLGVRPVSGLVDKALARNRRLVIVNGEPTPYDGEADVVVRADIPTVLAEVLGVTSENPDVVV
jgi:NAD-dependent deacetylase